MRRIPTQSLALKCDFVGEICSIWGETVESEQNKALKMITSPPKI